MSEDPSKLRRVGGFELLHEIGEGGMGTVWKARQVSLDRIVALKLLSPEFSQSTEFIGRFRNEARAAALLTHRHIVQVYDAGKADDANYLAMEFIEGKSVHALVQARGKMSETEALDIVLPVAMALRYAFERAQLIHRDVKPENILIDRDGVVKLCDLGLAKIVTGPESLKLTRSGMTLGTPFYISPEQAEGRDLDARSDVYSLGATLYHMVTGHAPFEDASTAIAMMKQVKETVPDARQFQPQLSPTICMVIEKMMAKDRRDRYQNWAEVISDLQLVRIGRHPVNARLSSNRSTMQRRENIAPGSPARVAESAPVIVLETKGLVMTPLMWAGVALIAFCLLGSGVLFVLSEERETALRAEMKNKMTAARGDAAARSYYEAVEFARTHPLDCDEITNRFTRVLHIFRDTSFAEQAASQVVEWEKRCVEVRKQRARQETATRNALAADARRKAEARTKAEKAEAERKAVQAAKEAEEKRRAAEEAARARQTALAAYHEFCPAWQALLARRDYPGALLAARAAVSDPNLAPQKQLLTTHVAATERIRAFIARLLAPDSPLRGKTVALSRIAGTITAVTAGRSVTIEKMAGVAASMPLLMLPPDDFLKLAAVGLKADNAEDQITGALLALAEGRVAPASAALQNMTSPTVEPFKQMMAGIAEALAEREAVAALGDLRTQLEARQWPFAFAKLTLLDTRYTNTLAFAAAGSELAEARDRLLAAPPTPATAEPAARLALAETGRAAEAHNWKQALLVFTTLDAQLNDPATAETLAPATVTEIGTMRRRLILESGMPEAALLGDAARRRAIAKAGGYVWTVKAEGGNAASLQDALLKADDGDAIELDGGTHVVSKFDGAAKPNLVIYGRGGTLPIITDATVGGTNTVGGYILACGDDWQLENLHFQFSTAALYQRGTNLIVRGCAFTRSFDPRRSGYAVYASCNADWRLSLSNCLVAAPDSEVLVATPYRDTAPRYSVEMNHCTLWTLVGTVFSTSQRTLERHFALNLRNSVVVAQRVASAVWTRDLMRSSLTYTGDRNLAYVVRYADETPTLGDENWKELFPGQDTASLITPVTYASLTALRRGRHAPAMRDFVSPSQGDLRLASDSAGLTLADDGTETGVRWPAWRWEQYLKNAAETTPSELAESGTVLTAIVPPVLTESQRVQAAEIPLGSLFQGAVQELPDGRIELKYDFAGTNQMADWRVIRPASATGAVAALPSFTVTTNAVRKSVLDLSLLAHRARFKGDVVLQFNASVEKGAVVAGVLSFPNERLAAVADLSSGLRVVSREVGGSFDVITNLSVKTTGLRSFPLIVGTEGNKLIESVPDIGMLEATLPRVRAVCEVALAADRALARFSQVRLTGTLDTNWVAVARAVALLGPDILTTNTTAALSTATATNVATLTTTNVPTFASLTQAQQLKASQLPITALFKGDLKELGGDKYEWTYDLSKPEHRADWDTETPAVWVTDGGPMSRRPGAGKPLWFRARLRGNFTASCRVQTTGSGAFQLALRYGSGEDASWIAAGLGTFSGGTSDGTTLSGFGIGKRSATSRVMAELNRHPYSLSGSRATLAFYCSQTSDLLRAQLHRRDTDKTPVRAETHLTRADVPFTLGFDGDTTSQYEVSEIHITGSPDLEWIRAEQARALVQSGK